MKRTVRVITVLMLIAVMVMGLTSCGFDVKKITGKWSVSTINGKSAADLAAEVGTIEAAVQRVFDIGEKETTLIQLDVDGSIKETKGENVVKSNGIEVTLEGATFPLAYDEKADTLTYALEDGGTKYDYVYKRGDYSFTALNAPAPVEEASGEEEYYDDGEYYEE